MLSDTCGLQVRCRRIESKVKEGDVTFIKSISQAHDGVH